MRIVTAEEVHTMCDWPLLVDALADAHRQPQPMVGFSELHTTGPAGDRQTYLNLPAWQPGLAIGTKIVIVMPSNPGASNLPAVQALLPSLMGRTVSRWLCWAPRH